ncbi:hypothetical protein LCGC14_1534740 [marine sediment metagenome]|uniref:HNH nuclease domain-containing protein n=1 Tax=marine sediment metagenome TaxID=412755 RepID=A0A0F9IUY9_9ZZZZ
MNNIEWRKIEGYDGMYLISSDGSIKSVGRIVKHKTKGKKTIHERILEKRMMPFGYMLVSLWKNNNQKTYRVSRLVASAFIPNPLDKPTVNHINGNKTDDRVENLEWATYKENEQHAWRTGLKTKGPMAGKSHTKETRHKMSISRKGIRNYSKLSQNQVDEIRNLYASGGYVQKEIAEIFHISRPQISNIVTFKQWKDDDTGVLQFPLEATHED